MVIIHNTKDEMSSYIYCIFAVLAVGSVLGNPTRYDVCDEVYRTLQLRKSSGADTPSPIDINFCMGMVHHQSSVDCTFDVTQCTNDCEVMGFEMDEAGCQTSCSCKSSGFFEEDIKYDAKDVPVFETNYLKVPSGAQDAASLGLLRWNENRLQGRVKVPYVISDGMSSKAKEAISEAISAYGDSTCVDFVERSDEEDYIHFVSRGGCWSYIGRRGGRQDVSIGNGCEWKGVVQHELMHALGFWHEQSRPDRDEHVIIQIDNVMAGKENNFNVRNSVNSFGSPYDIGSLMHYGGYAFSKNLQPTILIRSTNKPVQSQRDGFTEHDSSQINKMYECPATVNPVSVLQATWSEWSPWGTCSVTCGNGVYTRTRTCRLGDGRISKKCNGSVVETESCAMKRCLIATTTNPNTGTWESWQTWGDCSKSCGSGVRWRKRQCTGGFSKDNGCSGQAWQSSTCNTNDCTSVSQTLIFGQEQWNSTEHICRYGSIYSGDFNGDGREDLLCYYADHWTVVYLASSSGRFSSVDWQQPVTTCKAFNGPGILVTGDLNGDGLDDLLCQCPSRGSIRVSFSNADGFTEDLSWKGSFPEFCIDQQSSLMLMDVDGDNLDDLVCKSRYGKLVVLYNQFK